MLPSGYELTIPASECPHTQASDRAPTGIGRNALLTFEIKDVTKATVDSNASSYTVASTDTSKSIFYIARRKAIYFHSS